ncbi:MAG TPA: DUF5916 domain-containing protein [Candidatus Polarisedimenticolaceae bacterium]|nr:DUF5916 domain-containing protein [Candidatus Polarisedimenticolaceae bacterium]
MCCGAAAIGLAASSLAADTPSLRAPSPAGRIRVDGVLDDPAWADAAVIADLNQQDPHPGEATPFHTEVRVLADADNVYFAFRCVDPEPDKIAVHTLQRDGNLDSDDHVTVVLDTFLDGRTGFYFSINAAGAKLDGLIFGPDNAGSDWDGIWEGRARRNSEGWTAEIALPAKTLHFAPNAHEWGLNVERVVPRHRLHLRWTATTLDAALIDVRRCGRLAGVDALRQGLGLSFVPYALARYEWERADENGSLKPAIGGDLYDNFTPSLTGVLTVNTDFAETEVDAEQINLTRFPLFFPEKRAFFLEGSSNFDFGVGLGTDFVPFFSRSVGLLDGRRVPILAGVKLFGRAGRWGIGVLDTFTDDLPPESGFAGAMRTNLGAARVTFDASEHLRLGTIVTDGDPSGATENRLFGADLVWQTSKLFGDKNFTAGSWWTRSGGDLGPGDPQGYGVMLDYPNDLWDMNVDYRHFGDALDPKLGFLPRRNVDWYSGYMAYQPRPGPGAFGWARQFFFEVEPKMIVNLQGVTETWRVFVAPFNVVTQHGDHFEADWIPTFEQLLDPFEVAPGVVIPPGGYHFTQVRVQAESSEHRPLAVSATSYFGGFFTGRLIQTILSGSATTRSGRHRVELVTENDYGYLPQGDFIERLHQLRWTYSQTPDLTFSLFTQYETTSRILGWNARFRWTLTPGDDFFVVWTRNWLRTEPDEPLRFQRDSDSVVVKLRWTFRK